MNVVQSLGAQPWVERLGWMLLHFLWQGAAVAVIYAAVRRYGLDWGPNGRYFLACAALLTMALAPAATAILLSSSAPQPSAAAFVEPLSAARSLPVRAASTWLTDGTSPRMMTKVLPWLVLFWLIGATAFSLRLATAWIFAQRLRRRMVRPASAEWQRAFNGLKDRLLITRPVRLLVSGMLQTPAAIGWLRPVVLMPVGALAGLPPDQIEALLLHELAHIRRHDYLIHIVQSVIEAVLFYHPAVWWISSHMRAERELCCDDMAVAITGDAVVYARALAEFELAQPLHAPAMAANTGSVAYRIARLLGYRSKARRRSNGAGTIPALVLLALGTWVVFAQPGARPKFEVASVKPSYNDGIQNVRALPGRLTADASLQILMQYAYGVQPFQIVSGPDWRGSERFQIEGKADGNSGRARIYQMLQSLLEDRFQLKIHRETRELPVYALVAAKSGLKLSPPKDDACVNSPADAPVEWAGGRMAVPGEMQPGQGLCGSASVHLEPKGARMQGGRIGMPELARVIALVTGRHVIDKTGFSGLFDVQLDFIVDEGLPNMPPPPPGSELPGPSLREALRQRLGLDLESTKGPVEVIVIDHVERPTAN